MALPELGRSQIGEASDAVLGRGVQSLVPLGPPHVGLEHRESVVVLLLARVRLAEFSLEQREVVLRSQHRFAVVIVVVVRGFISAVDDLADQRIGDVHVGAGEEEEERGEEEERQNWSHL